MEIVGHLSLTAPGTLQRLVIQNSLDCCRFVKDARILTVTLHAEKEARIRKLFSNEFQ